MKLKVLWKEYLRMTLKARCHCRISGHISAKLGVSLPYCQDKNVRKAATYNLLTDQADNTCQIQVAGTFESVRTSGQEFFILVAGNVTWQLFN